MTRQQVHYLFTKITPLWHQNLTNQTKTLFIFLDLICFLILS